MTPDELRLRQALIMYGANAYAFQQILAIAEDIRRTAYEKGRADRTEEIAAARQNSETGYCQ